MHDVVIVGDGPGGLSAALFLAKAGKSVIVFGADETPMHRAMLNNYLGRTEAPGADFVTDARAQVARHGAALRDERAQVIEPRGDQWAVRGAVGDDVVARFLVLAVGDVATFRRLGMREGAGGWEVDLRTGRTNVPRLYAMGWAIRKKRIQAIISAGDGAAIALDILSEMAGRDVNDFDVVRSK